MAYVITIRVFILLAALFDYPTNTNTLTWYSFRSPFKKSQFMVHGSACFFAHTHTPSVTETHKNLHLHANTQTYLHLHMQTPELSLSLLFFFLSFNIHILFSLSLSFCTINLFLSSLQTLTFRTNPCNRK